MVQNSLKQNVQLELSNLFFFGFYYIIILVVGLIALYFGGGIESFQNLLKYIIYLVLGFIILSIWLVGNYILPVTQKKDYDFVYLHDPNSKGVPGIGELEWVNNKFKLLILSFVVFTPMFIWASAAYNKTFIAYQAFSIAPSSRLFFSAEPASYIETLIISLIAGVGFFIVKSWSKDFKRIFIGIIGLIVVFAFTLAVIVSLHNYVYGGDQFSLAGVAVFFFINILVMMLVGSIIPSVVMHVLNNGVGESLVAYGKSIVLPMIVFVYVIIWMIFIFVLIKDVQKKKSRIRI